jgi:circadian clock protein KaiC
MSKLNEVHVLPVLEKEPTGICGLDEITGGGLPKGRPTLVCGDSGSGKTLLGMEFLVRGATQFEEPGVFVAFEENLNDLAKNFGSLGFDINGLIDQKKLAVLYIHIEPSEIEEAGEFDLEGLFVRIGYAIDTVGAKRVVLDTIEALFGAFPNQNVLRAELRRLFRWLKDRTTRSTRHYSGRTMNSNSACKSAPRSWFWRWMPHRRPTSSRVNSWRT